VDTKEYYAQYRAKNKKKLARYKQKWRAKNLQSQNNYEQKRYWSDPEKFRKQRRQWHHKVRFQIIDLLGGKCVVCGFSDWRALQVDHIKGGGYKERVQGHTPSALLKDIIKSIKNNKKKYQLLCANCNWIKRYENKEMYSIKNKK